MLAEYQMTSSPLSADNANGIARDLLKTVQKEIGFVPNMYVNMAHSPGLLQTYMAGYNAFRKDSSFSPQEQEVVLLTIGRENGCEYCVSTHSMIAARQAGVNDDTLQAIREGRAVADSRLAALSEFTRKLIARRGLAHKHDVKTFLDAGFSEGQILEIVLAIGVETLSIYSNHLFHTGLDEAFADWEWKDINSEPKIPDRMEVRSMQQDVP